MPSLEQVRKYHRKKRRINKIILQTLRDGEIVHGAVAVNKQIKPKYLKVKTTDIDAYSKNALMEARQAVRVLNSKFGGNYFYVVKGKHEGTFKIKSRITGKTRLDMTKQEKKIPYKTIRGVRYATLKHLKEHTKKTLEEGGATHREGKDKDMLNRIRIHQQRLKNLKKARRVKKAKNNSYKPKPRKKIKRGKIGQTNFMTSEGSLW